MLNARRFGRGLAVAVGLAGLALGTAAVAAKPDTGPAATVKGFFAAFNKGDIAAAEAANAPDVSIIDEVPPHHWSGPGAFKAWAGDLDKHDKAAGLSAQKVTYNHTDVATVAGDDAYVVSAVTYSYKAHGKPTVEPAHVAVALHKDGDAWKIVSWAWAGTVPHAVAPKPAAPPAAPAPAAPAKP